MDPRSARKGAGEWPRRRPRLDRRCEDRRKVHAKRECGSGRDLLTDERRLFEDLCTTETLKAGFRRVKKNKGSPGIDGVTIAAFEARLDEELSRLEAELASWTYKPSPVRRVEIPKPRGKGIRLLGVPTVRDRVVHASLKLLLAPIFEPLFSGHSYGFRPERNQGASIDWTPCSTAGWNRGAGASSMTSTTRRASLARWARRRWRYSKPLDLPACR